MATTAKGTAVARTDHQPGKVTLASQINDLMTSEQARNYIEPFLPAGTDLRRVAASLLLAIRKDESGKLKKCTPESLLTGIARIMQWGAELGTSAYLIPFGDQATPVRDYKFLAELSAACGYPMEGHPVRQGDEFSYEYGLQPVLRHVPKSRPSAAVTHAYVIVHPPRNAAPIFHVMTAEQVEEIRQKHSKQWKTGALPGWYAVKTVVRQVTKLLPKDPKLAALLNAVTEDEAAEAGAIAQLPAPATQDAEDEGWEQLGGGDAEGGFQDDRDIE